MKNFDFKKALPRAVTILLCIFFVAGVFWGIDSVLNMEGTLPPPYEAPKSLSPRPQTPQEILTYLNTSITKALNEKPRFSSSTNCKLNGYSFQTTDEALLTEVAQHVGGSVEKSVEDSFLSVSADFGEDFTGKVNPLRLAADSLVSAECLCEYYVCPVCGKEDGVQPEECPECGNKDAWEERCRDEYTITLLIEDGSSAVAGDFTLRSPQEVATIIRDGAAGFFSCDEPKLQYRNAQITARVNRLTNQILSLSFKKETVVSLNLDFTGDFASLGIVPAEIEAEDSYTFDFTWPGLSLSARELSLAPKKTEALVAALTCSDPVNTTVRWSIADESIAVVDSEGYVKAGKNTGQTTVTASFDFQGKTYSDTCTLFVKESVEGLDLSKRRLTLSAGETAELKTKFSPKKATIQTVKWYTSDETVATVDPNGLVTAAAPGSAEVYAVTDDGYFKATCRIEVKS